jgi:hypothetical protein
MRTRDFKRSYSVFDFRLGLAYTCIHMYTIHARPGRGVCPNSLGTGGFSVTNFTVLATGVVGADTLLVAIDTCTFTGGGWSEPGAFDSIKLIIGLSSAILNEKKNNNKQYHSLTPSSVPFTALLKHNIHGGL